MRSYGVWVVAACVHAALLFPAPVEAKGDGTFQAPLTIPAGGSAVTVSYGDFNKDGKLDLVVANGVASNVATGSANILVLMQNPTNRQEWKSISLRTGVSSVFVRGADMDNDGYDDIMVGDTARSAMFVRSKGDGTFDAPVAIAQASGARWIAIGDFNKDKNLDFASANFVGETMTVFLGDGTGKFTLKQRVPGSREHTLEAMDFDGDGFIDLMQGSGLPGITPYKNNGQAQFAARGQVGNLGCIEYISEVGHYKNGEYVITGDLNKDGKGDLAVTCIDDGIAYGGTSLGTGAYRRTIQAAAGGGTDSSALRDLNGDGHVDYALTSRGDTKLLVYPGKGDGNFLPPVTFGPTGVDPVFLISQDLDGDGHNDVISAEQTSRSVTVFWGKAGDRFLESGLQVIGFAGAKGMGIGDLDRDGKPDLFFPRSDRPAINVYLNPGPIGATRATLTLNTQNKFTLIEAVDLDVDGIVDLVGTDLTGGKALVTLLTDQNGVKEQAVLDAGIQPSSLDLGTIDEGTTLDMAIACKGSNHVALFYGVGNGTFAPAKIVPTIEKPKSAGLGNLDGDGFNDLVVIADTVAAIHYGKGLGDFVEASVLLQDTAKLLTDVATGDVNGDGILDIVLSDSKGLAAVLIIGKGSRTFDAPVVLKTSDAPIAVVLSDLDADGKLDITTSSAVKRSVSIFKNKGTEGFSLPVNYGFGLAGVFHRVVDMNGDGALDLVAFMSTSCTILLGRAVPSTGGAQFKRGDASADGAIAINDPILVLNRLFLGGEPIPCEDAADADNDGTLQLNDPILVLNRLFLGGDALAPPGPEACGADTGEDTLTCAQSCQ